MIPRGSFYDDVGDGAESFDVVDDGGFVFESVRDGTGGLVAGEGMFPLERVEQRAFLSTDVGTGTASDVEVEFEAGSEDIITEKAGFPCFGEALFEEEIGFGILVAKVNESAGRAGGISRDDHSFDEGEGIIIHEGAVFETPRFSFVGIADDGLGMAVALGDGFPFKSGGESGSSTAREFGVGDRFDHCHGCAGEDRLKGKEPAIGAVACEGVVAFFADVGKEGFFDASGIDGRERRWRGFELSSGGSGESGVPGEDRDGSVATARAGHFGGGLPLGFESFEDLVSSTQATDVSGANARGFEAARGAGKVVVESDGAVEISERRFQAIGNRTEGVMGQVAVAIMKGMKQWKERSGLVFPLVNELLVGCGNGHGKRMTERP